MADSVSPIPHLAVSEKVRTFITEHLLYAKQHTSCFKPPSSLSSDHRPLSLFVILTLNSSPAVSFSLMTARRLPPAQGPRNHGATAVPSSGWSRFTREGRWARREASWIQSQRAGRERRFPSQARRGLHSPANTATGAASSPQVTMPRPRAEHRSLISGSGFGLQLPAKADPGRQQ
nr:uncharacterized protein LOC127484626 isoform X2 [Oryctolagus cuniculus]